MTKKSQPLRHLQLHGPSPRGELVCLVLVFVFSSLCLSPAFAARAGNRGPKKLPTAMTKKVRSTWELPRFATALVDHKKAKKQDREEEGRGLPTRFAVPEKVDLAALPPNRKKARKNLAATDPGQWEDLEDGNLLWRLKVKSQGALSLNFGFSRFHMPPGGTLFIYTADGERILGPFTEKDNELHGQLWTPVIPADEVVLEATVPEDKADELELVLEYVNHDYKGFSKLLAEKSGSCNIDVACSQADPYQDLVRSVGVFSINGSRICTGTLINNTNQDNRPLFLSAIHCNITDLSAPSMVVYWNFENSTCRPPGSQDSAAAGDGSLSQYQTGAILQSEYSATDMALVELDDDPDPSFNVFFAGWNRQETPPSSAVCIHHPGTDEKRIATSASPLAPATYLNPETPGDGTHLKVASWQLGTTEGGSSGAPLFGPDGLVAGQLHGGYASCDNTAGSDWFGRLFVSWTGGGNSETRLQDWLDPAGTGAMTLQGKNLNCLGAIDPVGFTMTSEGGAGAFTILVNEPECAWTAVSQADWITVTSAASGTGSAVVTYMVGDSGHAARSGAIDINGVVHTVVQVASIPGDAVDNPDLLLSTNCNADWFVTSDTAYAGNTSLQSGPLSNGQASCLEASVTGPKLVSFYWKVSSEAGYDFLTVSLDGSPRGVISGEKDWEEFQFLVPAGEHSIQWIYAKDAYTTFGQDAGWLDKVLITSLYEDQDQDGVPDINDLCPDTPEGQCTDSTGCKAPGAFTQEELDAAVDEAVQTERQRWDAGGDNKKGLEEAIDALQTVSGIRGQP